MTKTSFGFGIVGLGMIADFHARAIAASNGGRLLGVAGRSAEKTADFARRHQVPFHTTSVAELVKRPEIDVICIATPSGAHLEPAREAIRAGKHVVVEKPVEIDLARVDELLAAADRAQVRVAAIFQGRFADGPQALKRAIEQGRFGRIALASADVKWYRKPEYYQDSWHGTRKLDGGGALMNQGIHAVDLLQWLVGLPEEVSAFKTRRLHTGIEVEDTVAAVLRFPDGALGEIQASTAHSPGWARRIEVGGEFGSACLEDARLVKWDFKDHRPEDEAIRSAPVDARLGGGAGAPNAITHEGHLRQIQDLIDGLRTGRPLAIDGKEARRAVALIRAIYDSAEAGKPVRL